MDEVTQIVIAHHLYIIVPMVVGVWIWRSWGGWKERFELWQLRRALEMQRRISDGRKAARRSAAPPENSASTSGSGEADARDS